MSYRHCTSQRNDKLPSSAQMIPPDGTWVMVGQGEAQLLAPNLHSPKSGYVCNAYFILALSCTRVDITK